MRLMGRIFIAHFTERLVGLCCALLVDFGVKRQYHEAQKTKAQL